jgi:muramidase (phage lysozyme)
MIAISEGTNHLGINGYNVLVGGTLFNSFEDHPRKKVWIRSIQKYSTAAGRYQILGFIYDHYKVKLGLSDFSPEAQDKIAIHLIKERKALDDVLKGNIQSAIKKVRNIWASLPDAGYGQKENSMKDLITHYKQAGGTVSA